MENLKNITSEEKIFSVSIAEALNSANSNLQVEQAESEKKISSEAPIKAPAKEEELSFSAYSKVTLQRTGAGRGGKWVTRVLLSPVQTEKHLEALAKTMRKALGCGAYVEANSVIVQGDISDRVEQWFKQKGVRKIIF